MGDDANAVVDGAPTENTSAFIDKVDETIPLISVPKADWPSLLGQPIASAYPAEAGVDPPRSTDLPRSADLACSIVGSAASPGEALSSRAAPLATSGSGLPYEGISGSGSKGPRDVSGSGSRAEKGGRDPTAGGGTSLEGSRCGIPFPQESTAATAVFAAAAAALTLATNLEGFDEAGHNLRHPGSGIAAVSSTASAPGGALGPFPSSRMDASSHADLSAVPGAVLGVNYTAWSKGRPHSTPDAPVLAPPAAPLVPAPSPPPPLPLPWSPTPIQPIGPSAAASGALVPSSSLTTSYPPGQSHPPGRAVFDSAHLSLEINAGNDVGIGSVWAMGSYAQRDVTGAAMAGVGAGSAKASPTGRGKDDPDPSTMLAPSSPSARPVGKSTVLGTSGSAAVSARTPSTDWAESPVWMLSR